MKSIGLKEARVSMANVVDTAEKEGAILLTYHGKPVAVVLSKERYNLLVGAAYERLTTTTPEVYDELERGTGPRHRRRE